MRVRMINGLPAVGAGIKHNAVTGLRNALGECNLVRLRCQLGEQPGIIRGQPRQVRIVRLGNDEHVNGSLRIDVAKCERAV